MYRSSLQRKGEFRENRLNVTDNLLKGVNEFLPYCPYLLADVCEALCRGSARNALEAIVKFCVNLVLNTALNVTNEILLS